MSDEELFDDIFRRIERIENNIDYARFDIQEQRISELEKKFESNSLLIRVEAYNAHTKEIAELKEDLDAIWAKTAHRDVVKNHSNQIAELRKLIQGNAISDLNHYNINEARINELREGLKEEKQWTIKNREDLLEKLDARQTEKKEYDLIIEKCRKCEYYHKECSMIEDWICNYKEKDSGGENPTLGDGLPVDARYPATDSKPPKQVGIVKEIDGDIASIEIINSTITDEYGVIWIHPKLLISEFVEKLKLSLYRVAPSNIIPYIKELIKEYEEKLK